MSELPLILVVDDDEEIRSLLARYLSTQSLRVTTASDRKGLLAELGRQRPDLIVLDVMLPDGSGVDICRELRGEGEDVPIILLTALREDVDRIIGLEIGADDYVGKPFNPRELAARVRAVLRRHAGRDAPAANQNERTYRFDGFVLDPTTRAVMTDGGSTLDLTGAEFDLLLAFVTHPGRVLGRDLLLDRTRGREAHPFDRSIDILVSRLRRKLQDADGGHLIKTVRSVGYQLVARVDVVEVPAP